MATTHVSADELRDGIARLDDAPADRGTVAMVVARPAVDEREVLPTGSLTVGEGLVGDGWRRRGTPDPDAQLTLIGSRWLDVITAGDRDRWPLAGDQVVVDLDLSHDNLRPGDRLRLGSALVEVTPKPHTGCRKFVARFGVEAQRIGSSEMGRNLRLRGIYVRVVEDGTVAPGDEIAKVPTSA